jgi:hypothetical protein
MLLNIAPGFILVPFKENALQLIGDVHDVADR